MVRVIREIRVVSYLIFVIFFYTGKICQAIFEGLVFPNSRTIFAAVLSSRVYFLLMWLFGNPAKWSAFPDMIL